MTERFKKAYDSLVRAFFEGTLAKGTCVACACGNIIFDAIGDPVTKEDIAIEMGGFSFFRDKGDRAKELWSDKRVADLITYTFHVLPEYRDEINEAGYSADEFAKIETAFESNTIWPITKYWKLTEEQVLEDQYRGLCAVVDVLMELDNMSQGADEYKSEFRKHPKLQEVCSR